MVLDVGVTDGDGKRMSLTGHVGGDYESDGIIGPCVGVGGMLCALLATPVLHAQAGVDIGGESARSKSKVVSRGNSLTLHSTVSYSTGDALRGAAGDMIVTPSVALRTIRTMPVYLNQSKCEGYAGPEETQWEMLESGRDLYKDVLDSYSAHYEKNLANPGGNPLNMKDDEKFERLKTIATEAAADAAWNAVVSHSVYDILIARIPQLRDRCLEAYCAHENTVELKHSATMSHKWSIDGKEFIRTLPSLTDLKKMCGELPSTCRVAKPASADAPSKDSAGMQARICP